MFYASYDGIDRKLNRIPSTSSRTIIFSFIQPVRNGKSKIFVSFPLRHIIRSGRTSCREMVLMSSSTFIIFDVNCRRCTNCRFHIFPNYFSLERLATLHSCFVELLNDKISAILNSTPFQVSGTPYGDHTRVLYSRSTNSTGLSASVYERIRLIWWDTRTILWFMAVGILCTSCDVLSVELGRLKSDVFVRTSSDPGFLFNEKLCRIVT